MVASSNLGYVGGIGGLQVIVLYAHICIYTYRIKYMHGFPIIIYFSWAHSDGKATSTYHGFKGEHINYTWLAPKDANPAGVNRSRGFPWHIFLSRLDLRFSTQGRQRQTSREAVL